MRKFILLLFFLMIGKISFASQILVPMDNSQRNHLKAYGIAYWVLTFEQDVNWLLNYKGGSFMFVHNQKFENELVIRGVSYEVISDAQSADIVSYISGPDLNM